MIGHISGETTLNVYNHITDTIQQQVAVRIDREIGGTNASPKMSTPRHERNTMKISQCE